ncbi:MAG: hypothetical protein HZB16_14410 [Armatimonadetes bacterium]|nr:hypothetical protein [Armatimonadota bacterium]
MSERRRWFRVVVATAIGVALLTSCGSGGSAHRHLTLTSQSGRAALPPDMVLRLDSLRAGNAFGAGAVAADGGFAVRQLPGGPQLAALYSPSGNPMLLGFLDATHPAVNARTTAEVLLFWGLRGYAFPFAVQQRLLGLLREAPEVAPVATAVAQAVAADPDALTKANAAVTNALRSFVQGFVPAGRALLVNPAEARSGLTLNLDRGLNTMHITNAYRRRAKVWVDQVSYVRESDNQVVQELKPLGDPFEVRATAGVGGGFVATLADIVQGTYAYVPTNTEALRLPLAPGSKQTTYRVVTGGLGAGGQGDFESLSAQRKSDVRYIGLQAFVMDIYVPLVFSIVAPLDAGFDNTAIWTPASNKDVWTDFFNMFPSMPGFQDAFNASDYWTCLSVTLQYLITSKTFQDKTIGVAIDYLIEQELSGQLSPAQVTSYTGFVNGLGKVLNALGVANVILAGFDEAAVLHDISLSNLADVWTVEATKPRVILTPPETTIDKLGLVGLSARVPESERGEGEAPAFEYRWANTGRAGTLTDTAGHSGQSFVSSKRDVAYSADLDKYDTDTVTVQVYEIKGSARELVGQATATVTVGAQQVEIDPAAAVVAPEGTVGFQVQAPPSNGLTREYHWTVAGSQGYLLGNTEHDVDYTGSGNQIAYRAKANGNGEETLHVTVTDIDGAQRRVVGSAAATITVREDAAQVLIQPGAPELNHGDAQVLTAYLSPPPADGATVTWRWTSTGRCGQLGAAAARRRGETLETTTNQVTYTAGPTVEGTDTVVAEALVHRGSTASLIGRGAATVTVPRSNRPISWTLTPGLLTTGIHQWTTFAVQPDRTLPSGLTPRYRWQAGGLHICLGAAAPTLPIATVPFESDRPMVDVVGLSVGNGEVIVEIFDGPGNSANLLGEVRAQVNCTGPEYPVAVRQKSEVKNGSWSVVAEVGVFVPKVTHYSPSFNLRFHTRGQENAHYKEGQLEYWGDPTGFMPHPLGFCLTGGANETGLCLARFSTGGVGDSIPGEATVALAEAVQRFGTEYAALSAEAAPTFPDWYNAAIAGASRRR